MRALRLWHACVSVPRAGVVHLGGPNWGGLHGYRWYASSKSAHNTDKSENNDEFGAWQRVPLAHGGLLQLEASGCALELQSGWTDLCDVRANVGEVFIERVSADTASDGSDGARVVLRGAAGGASGAAVLRCRVPEATNLRITGASTATLRGKIEGDVFIDADTRIEAEKLRGERISLRCANGSVAVSAVLEGQDVDVEAGASGADAVVLLRAVGQSLRVTAPAGAVRVDALYATAATLLGAGDVVVDSAHGALAARSTGSAVTVGGLAGAASVRAATDASLHIESLVATPTPADQVNAGATTARADGGAVSVTLAPSVAARVVMRAGGTIAGDTALHGRTQGVAAADNAAAPVGDGGDGSNVSEVRGTWPAAEQAMAGGSGKVSVAGAQEFALSTSFFGGVGQGGQGSGANGEDAVDDGARLPPCLVLDAPAGDASIQPLDWRGMMLRRMRALRISIPD
eukprot:g1451.t1